MMALAIALLAQWGESADRKVDRVMDFHRELTSGPTGEARTRLGWLYREERKKGQLPTYTRRRLRNKSYTIASPQGDSPRTDADRLLRFFERANAARVRGSLDEPTAALLLGMHATWWNKAIGDDETDPTRLPLRSLADWSAEYVSNHPHYPGFENWIVRTRQDFGAVEVDDAEVP